jgi:prevent-host-death family protein
MQTVYSMTEARRDFESLIERANQGETFTITRYGKPVAQFLPACPIEQNKTIFEKSEDTLL